MKMYLILKGLCESFVRMKKSELKMPQAHAAIALNLSDSQLMNVVNANDAREAWCTIHAFHLTTNMANHLWLKEKFALFKYKKSSIRAHVMKLERLVMEMRCTNCERRRKEYAERIKRKKWREAEGTWLRNCYITHLD
uniref:AlNc14C80G5249 protein n=1 Tax=Albugo laibachii Nc14 TaxID=890382 RepID=F0WF55_9STRA|nr:AlNc14C80G5249 [Albugo laibachii Nc14]|eukprot:CCA19837.1 AlNc14C80G5249 [Albugo laibachii Nc14]